MKILVSICLRQNQPDIFFKIPLTQSCQITMGDEHNWKGYHKILLLGGRGVGKTCINVQILHDYFMLCGQKDFAINDGYRKDNFIVDGVDHTFETFVYTVSKYSNIVVIINFATF